MHILDWKTVLAHKRWKIAMHRHGFALLLADLLYYITKSVQSKLLPCYFDYLPHFFNQLSDFFGDISALHDNLTALFRWKRPKRCRVHFTLSYRLIYHFFSSWLHFHEFRFVWLFSHSTSSVFLTSLRLSACPSASPPITSVFSPLLYMAWEGLNCSNAFRDGKK